MNGIIQQEKARLRTRFIEVLDSVLRVSEKNQGEIADLIGSTPRWISEVRTKEHKFPSEELLSALIEYAESIGLKPMELNDRSGSYHVSGDPKFVEVFGPDGKLALRIPVSPELGGIEAAVEASLKAHRALAQPPKGAKPVASLAQQTATDLTTKTTQGE